jgi:hypothetical protein
MSNETKTRATAGLAAVITGVLLIGTTGVTPAFGWALWVVGVGVLVATVPSAGESRGDNGREAASARMSVVRWTELATRRAAGAPRRSPGPSAPDRW